MTVKSCSSCVFLHFHFKKFPCNKCRAGDQWKKDEDKKESL